MMQQQAAENSRLLQLLAKHQKVLMKQVTELQAQANLQLWEQMAKTPWSLWGRESRSTRRASGTTSHQSPEDGDSR